MEILLDSAVRGIARLSPRIIDNMGIQVELSEATQVAAERFGVEAEAIDDTQRKAGLLSIVLRELGKQNRDIRLNRSRVASLKSIKTAFVNFKNTMAKEWADLFTSTGDKLEEFAHQSTVALGRAEDAWVSVEKNIKLRIGNIATLLSDGAGLNLTAFREAALLQEEIAAKQELTARHTVRAGLLEAKINTALRNQGLLRFENDKWMIYNKEWAAQLTRETIYFEEEKNKEETARLRATFKMRREEESRRSAADRARIKDMTEITRLAMGESQAQIDVENQQEKVNKLKEEGRGVSDGTLDAAQQQLIKLSAILEKEKDRVSSSGSVKKAAEDTTDALLNQIQALERQNALAKEMDPRKKAELKDEFALLDAIIESEKFEKKGLDTRFLKAELLALELKYKKDIDAIDADDATRLFNIKMAKDQVALILATSEERRVQISLESQIAEITRTIADDEERSLAIAAAKIEAKKRLGEIEQENMERIAETLAAGIGEGFGESANMLKDMDASLKELGRPERYTNIANGFAAISAQSDKIAKTTVQFATAVGKSGESAAKAAAASLGAIAPAVAGFVEGTKEKALIMMAFEAAMAVAEGAAGNIPGAIAHGIAAAMFGAMAGVAATQPTTALPGEETAGGGLITPAAGPQEQEAQRVTVNFGPGMILGLPQELGRAISDQINSMAGTGMESTAF